MKKTAWLDEQIHGRDVGVNALLLNKQCATVSATSFSVVHQAPIIPPLCPSGPLQMIFRGLL